MSRWGGGGGAAGGGYGMGLGVGSGYSWKSALGSKSGGSGSGSGSGGLSALSLQSLQSVDGKEFVEIKQNLKSQEEIDKFTVDDTVAELPRALAFLSQGHAVQRMATIANLPRLLRAYADRSQAFDTLFPFLLRELPAMEPDAQCKAAEVYAHIIHTANPNHSAAVAGASTSAGAGAGAHAAGAGASASPSPRHSGGVSGGASGGVEGKRFDGTPRARDGSHASHAHANSHASSHASHSQSSSSSSSASSSGAPFALVDAGRCANVLLPTCLNMLNLSGDAAREEVSKRWLEPFCALLPLLDPALIAHKLCDFALGKCDSASSVTSRYICARMWGHMAPLLSPQTIERKVLKAAMEMCQDTAGVVRQSMCEQLNAIARAVGVKMTVTSVLSELEELLRDEEVEVKRAALVALIELLDFLPPKVKTQKIIPLLRAYCQQPPRALLPLVAKLFGTFYVRVLEGADPTAVAAAAAATAASNASAAAAAAGAMAGGWSTGHSGDMSANGSAGASAPASGRASATGSVSMSSSAAASVVAGAAAGGSSAAEADSEPAATIRVLDAFYQSLATSDDPELRRWCAYHFPAVATMVGPIHFADQLAPTFAALRSDDDDGVRRTLACSLHEVAAIVGANALALFKDTVIELLADRNSTGGTAGAGAAPLTALPSAGAAASGLGFGAPGAPASAASSGSVADAVVWHLPALLAALAPSPHESREQWFAEILNALLQYEAALAPGQWRRRVRLFEAACVFPIYFKPEHLHDKVVPVLFAAMRSGAIPEKAAAGAALMRVIRCIPSAAKRADIVSRAKKEFGSSRSYWDRMQWIELCHAFCAAFSRRWYKKHVFVASLQLTQDPVSNVRRRACSLLVPLKAMLRLPNDSVLLDNLNKCVAYLKADNDKDVVEAALRANAELNRIDVPNDAKPGAANANANANAQMPGGAMSAAAAAHSAALADPAFAGFGGGGAGANGLGSGLSLMALRASGTDDLANRIKEEEEDALLKMEDEEKSKSVFAPARGLMGRAPSGTAGASTATGKGAGAGVSSAAAALAALALSASGSTSGLGKAGDRKAGAGAGMGVAPPPGSVKLPAKPRGSISGSTGGSGNGSGSGGSGASGANAVDAKKTLSNGMGMTATTIRVKPGAAPPPSAGASGSGNGAGDANGNGSAAQTPFSFTFNARPPAMRKPKPKPLPTTLSSAGAAAVAGSVSAPGSAAASPSSSTHTLGVAPPPKPRVAGRTSSLSGPTGAAAAATALGAGAAGADHGVANKMRPPNALATAQPSYGRRAGLTDAEKERAAPSPSPALSSWQQSPMFGGAAASASSTSSAAGNGGGKQLTRKSSNPRLLTHGALMAGASTGTGAGATASAATSAPIAAPLVGRRPGSAGSAAAAALRASILGAAAANAANGATATGSSSSSSSGSAAPTGAAAGTMAGVVGALTVPKGGRRSPRANSPANAAAALSALGAPPVPNGGFGLGLSSHSGAADGLSGGGSGGSSGHSGGLPSLTGPKPKMLSHYTSFPNRPLGLTGATSATAAASGGYSGFGADKSHLHAAMSAGSSHVPPQRRPSAVGTAGSVAGLNGAKKFAAL